MFPKCRRHLQLGGCGDMLPQKILNKNTAKIQKKVVYFNLFPGGFCKLQCSEKRKKIQKQRRQVASKERGVDP